MKLLELKISETIKDDILEFFKQIHNKKRKTESIRNDLENITKLHTTNGIIGAGIGLVTIGMSILKYNNVLDINQETINVAGVALIGTYLFSQILNKKMNEMRKSYLNLLNNSYIREFSKYMEFEKTLVKGLKASGVNVEYQKYDNYFIFSDIAKMDSNSPDIDKRIKEETQNHVKNLINAYESDLKKQKNNKNKL